MSSRFDVLIVGAGPAGSLAGEMLARKGARVCLFDGRPAGEPKACGGGVTSKTLRRYPHLLHAAGRIINKVDLYSPQGALSRLHLAEPFAIFSRTELDSYLLNCASRAGVSVVRGRAKLEGEVKDRADAWTLRTEDGRTWQGETLVAADGANSVLSKKLIGTPRVTEMEVAFGYRAPLTRSDAPPTVVAFLENRQGYAWAFPRLDHISFGIATDQPSFDHPTLDNLLWAFMVRYYRTRDEDDFALWRNWQDRKSLTDEDATKSKLKLSVSRYAARIPGFSAETWKMRKVAGANWALLGDAAGFADSITGEGIYYALRSGESFAEAYTDGSTLDYEERWRADFGAELVRAATMRQRFYGSFAGAEFTERMIQFARFHRGVKQTLGELISGDQGYADLKGVLLRRMLRV